MNKRTSSLARRQELGQRLKQAALGAGYRSASIGEKLGFEDGTVRGWWSGRSEPSVETLVQYARLTNRSLQWLMTGAEDDQPDSPETWVQRFDRLRMQGVDADVALEIATSAPIDIPPEDEEAQITEEERQLLRRLGPDLLWNHLSAEQQERFRERLKRERGDSEPR